MTKFQEQLEVLYEDNHLLAVNKPAMLPTMGVPDERPSLIAVAKVYLKQKYAKPGNVYLGVVSRLDAPVTGVVLLARTSKAARRLNEQFRAGTVEKEYWALVEGSIEPEQGEMRDWIRKDERHRRVHITTAAAAGAQEARLHYRLKKQMGPRTLVEIELITGRKHQIRVQLAHRGCPVAGDRKYGAKTSFPHGIALHSRRLVVEHPVRREPLELMADVPAAWGKA